MEAVLCSKKMTDDYLWIINEVHVQTLRPSYLHGYWSPRSFLGSFWAVWRGLLWCLKAKLRYWWFNKQYHDGYQLICLISQPSLITSRRDWYWSKGLFKGFWVLLRQWESSKNWWRYGQMKFVTPLLQTEAHHKTLQRVVESRLHQLSQ